MENKNSEKHTYLDEIHYIKTYYSDLLDTFPDSLNIIIESLFLNDKKTFNIYKSTVYHILNVSHTMKNFAEYLKKDSNTVYNYTIASCLHDIGKYLLNPEILTKRTRLTAAEQKIVELHSTLWGPYLLEEILQDQSIIEPRHILDNSIRYHHNYDDSMLYNKTEDEIEFIQMIRIVDEFDALASDRCYKDAKPFPTIVKNLKREFPNNAVLTKFIAMHETNPYSYDFYLRESDPFSRKHFEKEQPIFTTDVEPQKEDFDIASSM